MDPLIPPAIYGEAVAGQSAALRTRMKLLAGDLTKYTFDLAEAFCDAQETHCYLDWGFESLGDYAANELGIKERKAQYLARIVRVCKESGIKRSDYEPAGITKLRVITSLDPDSTFFNRDEKKHEPMVDYIVDLVAEAPELSTQEIEERVAHLKGLDGENSILTRSYNVTRSAYENTIKPALEAMRKLLGSKGRDASGMAVDFSDGACFEFICREFLNDPRNFMEEIDCSKDQIEVPEENHVRVCSTLDRMDSTEELQEQLQEPSQPLVLQSEN